MTGEVALLAEGVDRNPYEGTILDYMGVALLAEGVDRNTGCSPKFANCGTSPSSRRAWIEIQVNG